MIDLHKLVGRLKWAERKLFAQAWGRERVDFNRAGNMAIVANRFGIRGGYRIVGEAGLHTNVLTLEGQLYLLATGMAAQASEAAWYAALWQGAVTPAESWQAANFPTVATELVSTTEGYTGSRPSWTPDTPLAEPMNNTVAPTEFNFVTASSVQFQGAALLSSSARGGTSGLLLSAAAFTGGTRTQFDTDVFKLVYEVSLSNI